MEVGKEQEETQKVGLCVRVLTVKELVSNLKPTLCYNRFPWCLDTLGTKHCNDTKQNVLMNSMILSQMSACSSPKGTPHIVYQYTWLSFNTSMGGGGGFKEGFDRPPAQSRKWNMFKSNLKFQSISWKVWASSDFFNLQKLYFKTFFTVVRIIRVL